MTAKRFELMAFADDIGIALLTDTECLLDSAAEHQVSLWRQIHSTEWLSPAWMGVTFYYWSFYLCLAITRLTGRTTWFIPSEIARDLRQLGPQSPAAPGAGCYQFICGPRVSAVARTISLEKTSGRIHDELWRTWFVSCEARLKQFSIGSSTSLEERLFAALSRSAQQLGHDWPSAVRNAINYRTGFAYTAVRREPILKSFGYLKAPGTYDVNSVLDRFEQALVRTRNPASILLSPQIVLELLVDLTFVIHALTTELHLELLDRHRLDSRWRARRQRFLRTNGVGGPEGFWPL